MRKKYYEETMINIILELIGKKICNTDIKKIISVLFNKERFIRFNITLHTLYF